MRKQAVQVFFCLLVTLSLSGCSVLNRLSRYHSGSSNTVHYRAYAKNSLTGKVYYGGSQQSSGDARTTALRVCHRHAQALNVCRIADSH